MADILSIELPTPPPPAPTRAVGPEDPSRYVVGSGPIQGPRVINIMDGNNSIVETVDLDNIRPEDAAAAASQVTSSRGDILGAYRGLAEKARPARPTNTNGQLPRVGAPEAGPVSTAASPNLAASPESPGAPSRQVTFDIPNYGPLDSFYHQVEVQETFVVLVYDLRFIGQRSFPRHVPNPLAMHIHGTDDLLLVRTTGHQFELGQKEICILDIERVGSRSAYEQNEREAAPTAQSPQEDASHDGETSGDRSGEHAVGADPVEGAQCF